MRRIQCVGNLKGQRQDGVGLHRPARNTVLQCDPVKKFHHDEGQVCLIADFINSADVGTIQCGCGLRFTLELRQGLKIACHLLVAFAGILSALT